MLHCTYTVYVFLSVLYSWFSFSDLWRASQLQITQAVKENNLYLPSAAFIAQEQVGRATK